MTDVLIGTLVNAAIGIGLAVWMARRMIRETRAQADASAERMRRLYEDEKREAAERLAATLAYVAEVNKRIAEQGVVEPDEATTPATP